MNGIFLIPSTMFPGKSSKTRLAGRVGIVVRSFVAVFALHGLLLGFWAGNTMAADCGSMAASQVDWSGCTKRNLVLQSSDFTGANLMETDFALTDLSSSTFTGANVEKANLVRASLSGVTAEKANFARVEAYRTKFTKIIAPGASFVNAELQRSSFEGADLTGADFEKAEIGRVNFKKATISGVKFSLANLSRADLTETVFEKPIVFDRAFMFLTRIQGLDLSAATGLTQQQVDLTCGDDKTTLPAGLTKPTSWPCTMD